MHVPLQVRCEQSEMQVKDLFNALSKVIYLKKLPVMSKDEFLNRSAGSASGVHSISRADGS